METLFTSAGSQGVFTDFGVHVSHNHYSIMFRDCVINSNLSQKELFNYIITILSWDMHTDNSDIKKFSL